MSVCINKQEVAKGCLRAFPNRKSFEIRCFGSIFEASFQLLWYIFQYSDFRFVGKQEHTSQSNVNTKFYGPKYVVYTLCIRGVHWMIVDFTAQPMVKSTLQVKKVAM